MSHIEVPSFYAIIPAHVRYCKELEPNAKLLYGELTALATAQGYCWASNAYFAELYDVDERSIKNWIKSLKDQNFIKVEIEVSGLQRQRKIWISHEVQKMFAKGKNLPDVGKKSSPRGEKNVPYINTDSNTTNEREEAQAPPPKYFLEYKRLRIDRDKEATLIGKYGYDKVYEMYDRLDEYVDINPKKFKQYACHAAVVGKWLREDAQKTPLKFSQPEKNIELAKKVIAEFPEHVSKNEIQMQEMGILFCYGQVYQLILFTEFNFMIKLSGRLKKMNLELPV